MPDLSWEGARQFWKEFQDPIIYRVLVFMEGVEQWTLDGNEKLETEITRLGKELDDIKSIKPADLKHEKVFIQLAGHIKSSRTLRLLQAIDTVHPGSASKLLIHAEETSPGENSPEGLFLRRNIVFERLRLLSRVFASDRFKFVLRALEGEE